MKKRIAIISYHTCPLASEEGKETGGMNVYVLETAKQLAKKDFIIDIFTRSVDQHQPATVSIAPTLRVHHIKAGPEQVIPKKILHTYIPEFVENVKKFMIKEKITYDVFDCHYYLSGLAGLKLSKYKSTPVIMTFHTLALMKNLVARDEMEKEERERIDAEFYLTKEVQKIVATSNNDKEYLQYLYDAPEEKIIVIQPGVDTTLFKPIDRETAKQHIGLDNGHKIILFVGRIEPLKGIDGLLYAMKIMIKKQPELDVYLWIVGGDISQKQEQWSKELQRLEKIRNFFGMTQRVRFVGQQPQHELVYYYNASELVVMPSHYESFGMAALEAMACGIPVITTNVTGISYLLDKKEQNLITTANNPLLLAKQMTNLLTDHKEKDAIAHAILEKTDTLQWNRVARRIAAMFNKIIVKAK